MEHIKINDHTYRYAYDFKKNPDLRATFNALTSDTFGFSFEQWYQDNNWSYRYIPYTLFDGEKAVSNVSVSMLDFLVLGEPMKFVQIGTVMTDPNYRGKGLSRFLMEKVMDEWRDNCDLIYLFANDEVVDFYPKFDFVTANEHQHCADINSKNAAPNATKLDLTIEHDMTLLQNCIQNADPISQIAMQDGDFLIMFFATYIMQKNIYYIEALASVVFADYADDTLRIHDVFCPKGTSLTAIIDALATSSIQKITLGFTPTDTTPFDCTLLQKEDTTLFVERGKDALFTNEKVMFPTLSHT
ncbi:MAG: GNAT family N-acetyltransferase [Clostridia bacterium]|jgi:GNAT superfamily N-acetyltransferase|nr:GNAT family N-acetyltransferase [Clostridia bacterium]MBT7122214.1 GNAT family N-acetyltransferase [Clostridia bacterium]